MENVDSTIRAIEERNRRVEQEKAWEISKTRRAGIAVMTYFTAVFFLWMIADSYPLLHALIPAGGYVLSTLSLPWLRHQWMQAYCAKGSA